MWSACDLDSPDDVQMETAQEHEVSQKVFIWSPEVECIGFLMRYSLGSDGG